MAGTVTIGGKLLFPSDYLAAVEFQGKDVTLTVASLETDTLQMRDGGEETKWVMRFKETEKKLVLNTTNAESIGEIHGTDAGKWKGKKVTFYPARVKAFGAIVDAIRVRDGSTE
jgi:hypothetical protein